MLPVAIGGIIGSGYFLGTGEALAAGGPVGLLLVSLRLVRAEDALMLTRYVH